MKYVPQHVRKRYDEIAAEEDRQEKRQTLRTEIPREFIKKYLKRTQITLDAGGGTGVNAILMAKICRHVTLLDISPQIVNVATKNIAEARLAKKTTTLVGDISNLKRFKDGQFDFVLCVGDAISYVLNRRTAAIRELVRVAKRGSILLIGCDSRYGFLRMALGRGDLKEAERIMKTGDTCCGMGPRTHTYTVGEMRQLLEKNGCEILEIVSTPTLTDTIDRSLFQEKKRWARLKRLEMELCTKPELLGVGNHLLFVSRKR